MARTDHIRFAMSCALQLGPPGYKGCAYLVRILTRHVESSTPANAANYRQLIAATAKERDIQPGSVKKSIQWYINAGWKCGFAGTWERLTG